MGVNENGERRPVRLNKDQESISDSIDSSDHLRELFALRRVLAAHLDNPYTPSSAVAALSRQYRDLAQQIADLESQNLDSEVGYSGPELVQDADWKPHAI